ncbi:MAG: hypothetical protein NDI88_16955 [Lysobacter sp.]|nr:hypothetical protein [Lysobacter sp.]
MSDRLEVLALERQLLVARSGLCRLKLRSRSQALRDSLSWRRAAVAAAATPAAGRLAFDLALTFFGGRRAASAVVFASRALSLARIVKALAGYARIPAGAPRSR